MATSYVQGYDTSTLKSHQSRSAEVQADYLLPHIKSTDQILDVGCGPGTITCDFAKYAPHGQVIGVDFGEKVIEQARAEASARGVKNIKFQVAGAHSLPFEDESFDVVHCHALLVHLPNAAAAVKEMWRVCKVGGFVGCREPDWDTLAIHPYNSALEKWKVVSKQLKVNEGAEPNAGRHLGEWAIDAGFNAEKVQITSNVLQYFGKEELKWWGSLYADRVHTEFGERAVSSGMVTREEIEQFASAYLDWSNSEFGIWAMMHMRLLCQK